MKFAPVVASLLLFTSTLTAADAPPQKIREEIVVTASAVPETVESTPAAVTVITKKDMDDRAVRDVADALREVAGLTVSRSGSPGRATSLFTRGSNSTHTLVLWNGIEINNPYFAGYDWGRVSTAGVQQVEVVRGPFSALYGSEAVAGVVNVLTTPDRSGVRVVAEGGGHGLRNGQVAASYVEGGQTFTGSFEKRQDDGFAANDDFSQTSGDVLWKWTSASKFSAGVAARYTSYDLGIPFNLNGPGTAIVPSPQRRQNGNERQIALPLSQAFGTSSVDLTLSESRRSDLFSDPEDPFGFVSSTTESNTRRARLQGRMPTAVGTVVGGVEGARAVVNDVSNFGPNLSGKRRSERAVFVEDRIEHAFGSSKLELSAGARYDHFDTFGSETSPRIAAAWVHGLGKFRVAAGSAFRAPSIGELYFPFSGNRALAPERTQSYEAGYDRSIGAGELSVTAFRSRFRDLIVFDNATFAFANVGRASSQGVELSIAREVVANLRVSLSYSYLDTNEAATDKPLLRRPRNSGSVFIGYRAGNTDTNLVIVHSGVRADVLPVSPFSRVSDRAYTTFDINVQTHLDRLTPYVKIENAANAKYEEVRGFPSPARRAVVGIRFAM